MTTRKFTRILEQNPDLNYSFIKEALLAKAEVDAGKATKYVRRDIVILGTTEPETREESGYFPAPSESTT